MHLSPVQHQRKQGSINLMSGVLSFEILGVGAFRVQYYDALVDLRTRTQEYIGKQCQLLKGSRLHPMARRDTVESKRERAVPFLRCTQRPQAGGLVLLFVLFRLGGA